MQRFVPKMVQLVDQRARLENIRIVQEIEEQLPDVISDANQLQQVFLNLFNNAIYALKGRTAPEIRVHVYQENTSIAITVADNGCGFSSEDMKKAFVPFFLHQAGGSGNRSRFEHGLRHHQGDGGRYHPDQPAGSRIGVQDCSSGR